MSDTSSTTLISTDHNQDLTDPRQDIRQLEFKEQSLRLFATHLVPMATENESNFTNRFWVKGEGDNEPYFRPDESLSKTTLAELESSTELEDANDSIEHKIIDASHAAENDCDIWDNSALNTST